jgi:hypothetical protein
MASSDKVAPNFRELSATADLLNKSSDELTSAVGLLNGALQKLNIGLSVWLTYEEWSDERGATSTQHQIGYDKVAAKWGIALRRLHSDFGDESIDGPWLFTDAPREMRLASVDHLSALLHELSKKASETVQRVREKTEQTLKLVEVVKVATVVTPAAPVQDVSHLYNIRGHNINAVDIDQIMGRLLEKFPMVNAWLRYSRAWELDKGMLKIFLPAENPEERNRLAHEGTGAIEDAARAVLNAPITVRFFPIIGELGKISGGQAAKR